MRVTVIANTNLVGINYLHRAGRSFPVGSEGRELEVVEDEPPMVEVLVPSTIAGAKPRTELRPDPDRIGRADYEKFVVPDRRLTIRETGSVDSAIANRQLAAARREIQHLAGENHDLRTQLAEFDGVRGALDGQAKEIADLQEQLAKIREAKPDHAKLVELEARLAQQAITEDGQPEPETHGKSEHKKAGHKGR